TVTVTSFIYFNPSTSTPTYEPVGASTTGYFGLCDPARRWGRTYDCRTNTELVPLGSSDKSFFGTLGRAKTLPYRFDTLGSRPRPGGLAPKAKAIVPAPTLSSKGTTATGSTDEEVVTILPVHTTSVIPSPTYRYSIPVAMAPLSATVPQRHVALFLQAPVILASLGIFLLFCGLLWKFRVHRVLSPILLWPWRQIRQFLKDGFIRGAGRNTTIGPSAEAPEFLRAEKHEQSRWNRYLGSNFSTMVELHEDGNGLFQVNSRESRDGDTTTLTPSPEPNIGGGNYRDSIGESNSASSVRPLQPAVYDISH
ncbi:hypothetical protein C7212DRAFT_322984, partial [Tuber magnatum]